MKILIFTDSRGEHKRTFNNKLIFTEKLKKNLELLGNTVILMTCPYKWTTTFDFIEICEKKFINISCYDKIILYTGIVEYSPRYQEDALNKIYKNSNKESINLKRLLIPPNKKKNRIINEKYKIMDKLFTKDKIINYLKKPLNTKYNNKHTVNLLSLDMLKNNIIPWLKKNLENKLIYINCNNIVKNWEGNYIKNNPLGRPKNINIISEYSKIINENLSNVINLLEWTDNEIKKYTVDNMHLTFKGSEWLYSKIIKKLKE